MGMLTWEKAVSDYEKKKSSENASGKKASGMLTWDQAVGEYDKYDKEAYKALGQQRIAQRQQSIRDRASVSDDGNGREAVRDWVGRYNDVVKGISDYTESRNGGYTLDASGGYGADLDKLIEDFDSVKQYTYHYGIANPHQYLKHLEEIRDSIAATNADMARFNNEKEYNKALKAAQDYEQQKVLDLDATEKEIAELERKREDFYWNQDYDATSHRERVAFEQELKAQDELIDRKKQFLNQARHIQEGIRLSEASGNEDFRDYSGYVSTRDDGKWSKLTSKYGLGYQDLTYEYINDQNGIRDEIRQQHRIYDKGDAESEYEAKGYDLLTEEEVGIYNYYYAKEGREKAQQYLDNLQETLNYRKATAMYGKMEDRTALELAFGVAAGIDQFATGTRNLFNTEDDYIEDSAFQMASQMVRQDLGDVGPKLPDWMGGATLGQVAYDTVTTSANMAPSILTSMAANMIAPGSGVVVGNAMMFASSAGGAYQEALKLGYGKGQARAYSTLVGGSEAGLQYLLGGIGALGGKVSGNALTKILNGVDNAFARTALKLGGSMLSEGMEEGIQEILTPWFKNLTAHANEEVDWGEVAYSSLLGALTAGFMEGGGTVSGEVNTWKTGRDLQKADVSAQRLAEIGRTLSADTVAYQLAGRVNENTGAYTMGRLFNEIDAEITEQNKADIQQSLERKGVSHRDAGILAESFAGVVDGAEFTEAQKAAIEANDVLARTVQEVIIDPNSTVNQRSSGYRDVLMKLAKEVSSADTARTEQAAPGQAEAVRDDKVEGEKEQPAQSVHAVSEGGKTIKKSTGEAIEIREVESIRDGRMTLKLQDGSTVDADDVIYSSEGEALVYEAVAKMNVNASAANVLVNAFQTESGVDAAVYARGIQEAYRYGQFNYPVQEVARGPFSSMLTEHQRNTAYRLGKLFGGKQIAREEAAVRKNRTDQKSLQVGKVHFDGDRSGLTDRQKASISALETVAETLGIQIHVFESGEADGRRIGANGWYDTKDGSIHIDLHAGATGEGTMLFTAAHELTHFIKQWSPAKFKVLANFLMEEYGRKGVSVETLVQKQMEKARKSGRTLTYAAAYEEVIADSMETMLSDGKIVEKLGKLKQQDKSLWQKIRDYVRDLAAKIRKVYEGLTPDSEEGQFVAEMKDSIERLQELFTEGLAEASANYQASLDPDQEGTVTDETGELVAHSRGDGTIQLSMRTYEESGREALRKYLQKCVRSKRLSKAEMQEIRDGIEEIYSICKEFKDKYAPFGSWSDAAVVRDTHGKPVFSVVTPNGDYKMNLDFSLVCRKRRTLDAVFNEMARRGIIDDFEPGQKSVVKINEIIRSYGFETACALCFVDAKRFRQASMADSFVNLYNELVLSLVPEDQKGSIGHFNFSGYETIRKVEGGIDTWKNSRLDFSHIDHVLKTYGEGTVEHKAAQYIKAHPEGRKLLLRGDFMSSQGFDAVKTQNPEVLKLYNSKKGTGGPKAAFGDVQYMNEILKRYQWTPAKAYDVGGVRVQSFSDYVPRMVFDYVQMIYDLAVRKLPAHAYTKEALFAKQFGLTGIKINMSLIPAIAEGGIAPGLDANGDYVWAGESFDFETAKEIQSAEGYTENCGTICVGVSDRHIRKLLGDPDIRMVIPYHKSGLNPIVAHMNRVAEFTDYTNHQRTKGTDGTAISEDFDFSKVLHDMGENADPRAVVEQYLNWCDDNGYTPKFSQFRDHPNYYKLLEDFTLFDSSGNYVPQREVRAVFPGKDSAFGQMKTLIEEGLQEDAVIEGRREQNLNAIVDEIQKTLPRTEAEISEEQVKQADRDLEAGVKYSSRDYARQVDEVKNNTHDPLNHVYMGTTPVGIAKVLDLPKLPMLITSQHIYSMAVSKTQAQQEGRFKSRNNYHNLGWDTVKNLPEYINKPVLIIKSNTDPNDATFVVVTAQSDNTGNPIIVAVKPNGRGNYFNLEFPTNFMLSGYGKDGIQGYVARAKTENRILYAKKNSQKKNTPSVQFADNILSSDYTANLAQFKGIVKSKFSGTVFENNGLLKYSDRDSEGYVLSEEQQEFFKDSVVRDENGNLKRMYHGTANGGHTVFDLVANVRKKSDGAFGYSIQLNENKKIKASPPRGSLLRASSGVPNASGNSVTQPTPGVKLQDRPAESVSNRSLLANAFESMAQTELEKKKIREYKDKIGQMNAEEENLRAINAQLRKETDPKVMRELRLAATQAANRINIYDSQLLRLEASRPLQNVLTREKKTAYDRGVQKGREALDAYRERAEKKQQEIIDRYQEARERSSENRQKTAMRQKIRKVIRELDKILNRGDKKRNVKEDMKDFVSDALKSAEALFTVSYSNEDMVRSGVATDMTAEEARYMEEARALLDEIYNLPTGYEGWQTRQEQEGKLKAKLAYRMAKLKDVFARERARMNKTTVSAVLGQLADSYARLQNSEYAHVQGAYHENVHEYLKMLQEDIGGTIIRDMSLEQLEELYKAYTMVMTTVRNANRMFAANLNATRDDLARKVMWEVRAAGGEHGLWTKAGDRINSFFWNNLKPVYAFERIGSNTLKALYGNIRKGQDGWAINLQEANRFRLELYRKYKYSTWDLLKRHKFTSASGIDFDLDLNQMMSLYAYSKREQAHEHLLRGGFVFDGNTEVVVTKHGIRRTFLNRNATAYNLNPEILDDIISKLTAEQKAFVDEMQDYLSTTMGEKGNEVSMVLYGVKLFNEKFYFPLRSAVQYMERAKEADLKKEQGQINIANSGFSKATKIKASNPVVLAGFMDVWASHVNEMSMYHAFVLPMEDFRRVYNYSTPHVEEQRSASVNGVIQNAYGAAATDYIDRLYRDLNGGAVMDNTADPINRLMGLFKKGAVFVSASVTIQQPSAIARAAALVDLKHFIGPKVDHKRHKLLWEEVKKYAPVAIIKEMGFFDTNMGRSASDYLTAEEYSGIREKAEALIKDESYRDEVLAKAPALADELTWCVIWEAVKRETKAKHPGMDAKSEAFLKLAGERFSEVIDKTQVYDSVLARSANMRSKDTGMKMATAFMAEPTTSINMVTDAIHKGKKGNREYAARAIGSVVASVILNSFLVSWVYAARDDDEDESYAEKYWASFVSGIVDGVNPATYIPLVKDIVSIVQGYDVERSDMAVISDLWSAWQKLGRDDVSAWVKVEGFAGSIAQLFGLPLKNFMRDVRSAYQAYDTIVNGEDTTRAGIRYAIEESLTGKTVSNMDQLYEARAIGDEEHAARVEARYAEGAESPEDAAESADAAVREAIRRRYMDGKLDSRTAYEHLLLYANATSSEINWMIDKWNYHRETGSDEGYSKYLKFYKAVETGEDLEGVIQMYTENDVERSTLSRQLTEHFKPEYVEMDEAKRTDIRDNLLKAMMELGSTQEEAEDRIAEWDFEASYGFTYEDREKAYMAGTITSAQMRKAYLDRGKTEEEADLLVEAHEWLKRNHREDLYASKVVYYIKPLDDLGYSIEDTGMDVDVYFEEYTKVKEFKADQDENGNSIAYSKINKAFPYINSLDLTPEQKTALAVACGWGLKTVNKNKLW